jgi:hypothetical protein
MAGAVTFTVKSEPGRVSGRELDGASSRRCVVGVQRLGVRLVLVDDKAAECVCGIV